MTCAATFCSVAGTAMYCVSDKELVEWRGHQLILAMCPALPNHVHYLTSMANLWLTVKTETKERVSIKKSWVVICVFEKLCWKNPSVLMPLTLMRFQQQDF